jgi:hypothetical protein
MLGGGDYLLIVIYAIGELIRVSELSHIHTHQILLLHTPHLQPIYDDIA